MTGCKFRGGSPWPQASQFQRSLAFSGAGNASRFSAGAGQESHCTRVSSRPPSCGCVCLRIRVRVCASCFWKSLQTKHVGCPLPSCYPFRSSICSLRTGTVGRRVASQCRLGWVAPRWAFPGKAPREAFCVNLVFCLHLGLRKVVSSAGWFRKTATSPLCPSSSFLEGFAFQEKKAGSQHCQGYGQQIWSERPEKQKFHPSPHTAWTGPSFVRGLGLSPNPRGSLA